MPIAIIGLTVIRGLAGFVSQYGLAWAANRATQAMRRAMFQRVLDAEPLLFTRNTASNLVNTLTFEVQAGATQLVYSLQSLVGDSLPLRRPARLPGLAQLAADRLRRGRCCRRSPTSCASSAGGCTA